MVIRPISYDSSLILTYQIHCTSKTSALNGLYSKAIHVTDLAERYMKCYFQWRIQGEFRFARSPTLTQFLIPYENEIIWSHMCVCVPE